MRRNLPYIFVGIVTVLLILFPQDAIEYASSALGICHSVIIPSLFPFFVCSGLLIYSGVAQILAKISGPLMKPLFNIAGTGATAFVLGIFGGYPLGAITACQLYESGYLSKTETERLLAFCNNSGPLFILGAVGSAIYSSATIGVVLYVSHILSTLLVGFLFRFYKRNKHVAPEYSINQKNDDFPTIFSRVLSNSVNSILTVCGAIIFFGVVAGIITSALPFSSSGKAIIYGILELSGGTIALSESALPLILKLTLSAVCIGFSGVCVHLQVASITAKHYLSLAPYIIGKILHGVFSGLFTFLYLYFVPVDVSVLKTTSTPLSGGFCIGSAFSIINIIFFLMLGIAVALFTCSKLPALKK